MKKSQMERKNMCTWICYLDDELWSQVVFDYSHIVIGSQRAN